MSSMKLLLAARSTTTAWGARRTLLLPVASNGSRRCALLHTPSKAMATSFSSSDDLSSTTDTFATTNNNGSSDGYPINWQSNPRSTALLPPVQQGLQPTTSSSSIRRWFSTNPAAGIAALEEDEEVTTNTNRRFSDLENLHPDTLRVLENQMGFQQMTEIQSETWDAVSLGKDVLGRSRTGSGKTMAFLLPTLERISNSDKKGGGHDRYDRDNGDDVRMLIISPTRELASQIHKTAIDLMPAYRRRSGHFNCQVLYGGVSKLGDIQRMERQRPNIVVATPGRLLDHLQSSHIRRRQFADMVANIDVLVLDEMDRLLDMGFSEDIRRIVSYLPPKQERQTLLFSATVPPTVQEQIRQNMRPNYTTVDCIQDDDPSTHTVNTVQQSHVVLPSYDKSIRGVVDIIENLMKKSNYTKMIVFFNTTSQVAFFANLFRRNGHTFRVLEIHSKISQAGRSRTSDEFRKAQSGILLTSDVSARGVDYPNVTHVVQVGSATDRETYIHRLGRTGRAGKNGEGILVLTEDEVRPVLADSLEGIKIPQNQQLQELVDGVDDESNSDHWLQGALRDYDVKDKAVQCYKSLIGFYFQQYKKLGIRRPGDRVVDMVNEFAEEAQLEERPAIPAKVAEQYGIADHPDITVHRRGGFGSGGRGRGGGGHYGGRSSGFFDRRGRDGGGNRGGGYGRNSSSFDRYDSGGRGRQSSFDRYEGGGRGRQSSFDRYDGGGRGRSFDRYDNQGRGGGRSNNYGEGSWGRTDDQFDDEYSNLFGRSRGSSGGRSQGGSRRRSDNDDFDW